jgi:hypothetical protein
MIRIIARLKALEQEIGSEGAALHHVIETNSLLSKRLLHHTSTVEVPLGEILKRTAA